MKIVSNPIHYRFCAYVFFLAIIVIYGSCEFPPDAQAASSTPALSNAVATRNKTTDAPPTKKIANAASILSRPQVAVLCYHQIRDWRPTDSKLAKDYIVPLAAFHEQMKMLSDSGYHSISPDQLYDYLTTGAALPPKPVLLSFDDTDLPQYTVARPEMEKYGFKGMFFIMTVSLGRPNYMSREQVKALSDAGNYIGSHTWDHKNVKKYAAGDWATEVEKPTKVLEAITGKPIKYFAYPFGLWNEPAIPQLKQRGFTAAFQLSTKRDEQEPLYTIRRIIVPGSWTAAGLHTCMKRSF
jgi:peptidoglycan/xylan/chitin deacetylase (PgdA/CDA1 family)